MMTRLLWKEARELAPLWVGLLGIGYVVLLTAMRIGLAAPAHEAAAIALAGCFGLAAVARQFAGEEEDGTIGWLRMLPCDGRSVWWAKLGTAYVGAVLLWLPLAGMAVITAAQVRSTMAFEFMATTPETLGTFLVTAPAIGAAVALVSRHVLATVLGTGAVSLVVAWIAGFLPGWMLWGPWQIVVGGTALGTAWQQFGPWWKGAGGAVFESAAPKVLPARQRGAAIATAKTVPWTERTATRRMWRALIWQELRGAGAFLCWWLAIVPLMMTGMKYLAAELRVAYWVILVTPVLAGVWSLRRDQRDGAIAFLGERGVSAPAVWLSRQCVWLPVAVVLACLAALADATVLAVFNEWNLTRVTVESWWTVWERVGRIHYGPPASIPRFGLEQVLLACLLYAVGHLAAMLFRPLVLALVAGGTLGIVATWWQGVRFADVYTPWVWGALLPVALLLIAAGMAGPWMERRLGIKRLVAASAATVVVWVAMSYGVALSGLWAIPSVQNPETKEELRAAEARLLNPDLVATREVMEAVDGLNAGLRGGGGAWDERFVAVMSKWMEGRAAPQLDYGMLKGGGLDGLGLLSFEMDRSLGELAKAAGPESAGAFLLAYERLGRLSRGNGQALPDWMSRSGQRSLTMFTAWDTWVQRADVTPGQLSRIIAAVEKELSLDVGSRQANAIRMTSMIALGETAGQRRFQAGLERFIGLAAVNAPQGVDRRRLIKALEAGYDRGRTRAAAIDKACADYSGSLPPGTLPSDELDMLRSADIGPLWFELRRQGTALNYGLFEVPGRGLWWTAHWAHVSRQNRMRLLLVAMALEHHRKATGKLPKTLRELRLPGAAGRPERPIPVEILTGAEFGYSAEGFERPAEVFGARFAPGQPFLWLVGPEGGQWYESEEPERMRFHSLYGESNHYGEPRVVSFSPSVRILLLPFH